jgi:rhodanese-related sulfurtransferase
MMSKKIFISKIAAAALTAGILFTGCIGNTPSTPSAETKVAKAEHKKFTNIEYAKALDLYNNKTALFLDARGFKLYQKGTIMGALHMPVKGYTKLKQYLPADKATPLVPFCNGFACEKSDELAALLQADGYTNVLVYKGGYPEWSEKKQAVMGLKKECKAKAAASSSYKAPIPATEVNGVKIQLLAEDGEANEDGVIDQYWLEDAIKNNTVPAGLHIVDVRKPEKYAASHIEGAINVPFKDDALDTSKLPKDGAIVFYCNTGMKSTDARTTLEDELAERVFIFDATYKCDKDTHKNCTLTPNEPL